MIKKLIKKVKNFWYSTEGTMTMAITAIISTLTAILINPVIGLGAIVIVTIGGLIYILQIAQEDEN